MSWIKKFLKVFKPSEEDEYIEETLHIHDRASTSKEHSHESHRDVEARVLYQYPKGQFRFPLIPDEEAELGKRERREKREKTHTPRRPDEKPTIQSLNKKQTKHKDETFISVYKAKESKPEPKKTQKQDYSKRPFRPTEIPSPIYGFEKKAKKNETVEYELEDFSKQPKQENRELNKIIRVAKKEHTLNEVFVQETMENEEPVLTPNKEAKTDMIKPITIQMKAIDKEEQSETPLTQTKEYLNEEIVLEKKENEEPVLTPNTEEKADKIASIVSQSNVEDVEVQSAPLTQTKENLNEEIVQEKKENEEPVLTTNMETKTDIISSIVIQGNAEGLEEQESLLMKAKENRDSVNSEDLEVSATREEMEPDLLPDVHEEFQMEVESEMHSSSDEIITELPIERTEPKNLVAPILIDMELGIQEDLNEPPSIEQESEAKQTTLEEKNILEQTEQETVEHHPTQKKRSHIPFNVIMLKEDKRRLERRAMLTAEKEAQARMENTFLFAEREVSAAMEEVAMEETLNVEEPIEEVVQENTSLVDSSIGEIEQVDEATVEFILEEFSETNMLVEETPIDASTADMHVEVAAKEEYTNVEIVQKEETLEEATTVENDSIKETEETDPYYAFPNLDILKPPVIKDVNTEWLQGQEELLNETLLNFNVHAHVANVTQGPSVTRFEVRPEPGVKVNKITNLSDDIKLSLAARDIRMEAPIPGTHMIGIEVPNESSRPVFISEIIKSEAFLENSSPLTAALGLDISGKPIVTDLRKMPHGLIAGATGSGKSVCINSILVSILYKANPNEVKLLLIDPKMVELAPYNHIPHLVSPVITDVKAATAALKWAVEEMERRYELFAHSGVRDITRFNQIAEENNMYAQKLPYIVIVIDELADLMMMSPADVEEAICRIAQKARACGIHLIIATQRPSVDVITGLIKANVPTRIAFSVSSQVDSRTIIDISGAEKLLGRGDMLFLENGTNKPVRLQGTFVSDEEIDDVVAHVRKEQSPQYLFEQEELLKKANVSEEEDELFYEACEYIIDQGGASTSSLQRRFKIGYNRAARLIDMMEEQGFISESRGSKPRDVLITETDLESIHDSSSN